MVIIISYNKQTWNEYNDNQTADKNLANGAIISADRLNHMETGISNNDTNKVTDNKNGSIKVNGSSITPADDSKVVHNTGTEEIGGQKTFDVTPIDKTTGNPYITKDGVPAVPSTLADTTKDANFTAGLRSGGVSVATSDDLKSVEKSAWRQLNVFSNIFNNYEGIYKINSDEKYLEISACGTTNKNGTILFDLSSIINKIVSIDMEILTENRPIGGVHFRGAILTGDKSYGRSCLNSYEVNGFARVYYNNLQPGVI